MRIKWHIGDVVRKVREANDWKQEKLAAEAGVSLSTIGRLEDGRDFKPGTIDGVARALGVKPSALFAMLEQLQETQRSEEAVGNTATQQATGTAGRLQRSRASTHR